METERDRRYYRRDPRWLTLPLAVLQLSRTAVCRWSNQIEKADFHTRYDATCPKCPGGYLCKRCGKRYYR
jgi:hypothetical protein